MESYLQTTEVTRFLKRTDLYFYKSDESQNDLQG